jgi:hypothetical protein
MNLWKKDVNNLLNWRNFSMWTITAIKLSFLTLFHIPLPKGYQQGI